MPCANAVEGAPAATVEIAATTAAASIILIDVLP
jgi:hypothetical protein